MSNKYLKPLYKEVFGKESDFVKEEERYKMEYVVYIAQLCGVPIGYYGFKDTQHGPYSDELYSDMVYIATNEYKQPVVTFSKLYEKAIERIKKLVALGTDTAYSDIVWLECISTLLYIRENLLTNDNKEVLLGLLQNNVRFYDAESNQKACEVVLEMGKYT